MASNSYHTARKQLVILSCAMMRRIHTVFTQSGVSDREITQALAVGSFNSAAPLLKAVIICDRRPLFTLSQCWSQLWAELRAGQDLCATGGFIHGGLNDSLFWNAIHSKKRVVCSSDTYNIISYTVQLLSATLNSLGTETEGQYTCYTW